MDDLTCTKCRVPLELAIARFHYIEREFQSEVLKCPKCGQVYLSEELVTERIRHIEEAVEDK